MCSLGRHLVQETLNLTPLLQSQCLETLKPFLVFITQVVFIALPRQVIAKGGSDTDWATQETGRAEQILSLAKFRLWRPTRL